MRLPVLFLLFVTLSVSSFGQCPGLAPGPALPVPRLQVTEELWASSGQIILSEGEPFSPWLLALDLAPAGPLTPPGICVGLSPAFQIVLDATTGVLPLLDASGRIVIPLGLPPTTTLPSGTDFFLQGAVFGPTGVGLTNGVEWNYRQPRVVVSRSISTRRELDIYNGQNLFAASGVAATATIPNLGGVRAAFSADGKRMHVREISSAFTNAVQVFDVTGATPFPLGAVTIASPAPATDRMGIVIAPDDNLGYFADLNGLIQRFDANPTSPTYLSSLAPISSSIAGPGPLGLTSDGSLLVCVPGSPPPVGPSVMTIMTTNPPLEIASVPLSDTAILPLIGGASRGRIAVSNDDRLAVTVAEGFLLPPGPFGGSVMGNISVVDIDPSSPTFATELSSFQVAGFATRDLVFNRLDPSNSTVLYTEVLANGDVVLRELFWPASTILRSVTLATGAPTSGRPASIQASRNGSLLYVAVASDSTLRVLDGATFAELTRTTVGGAGAIIELNIDGR